MRQNFTLGRHAVSQGTYLSFEFTSLLRTRSARVSRVPNAKNVSEISRLTCGGARQWKQFAEVSRPKSGSARPWCMTRIIVAKRSQIGGCHLPDGCKRSGRAASPSQERRRHRARRGAVRGDLRDVTSMTPGRESPGRASPHGFASGLRLRASPHDMASRHGLRASAHRLRHRLHRAHTATRRNLTPWRPVLESRPSGLGELTGEPVRAPRRPWSPPSPARRPTDRRPRPASARAAPCARDGAEYESSPLVTRRPRRAR